MKKILLILLSLCLLASMTAVLTSCKEEEDEPCTEHVDENGDHICDDCEEIIFETETEVTVTFTVKDTDGNLLSGIKAIFTDEDGNKVTSEKSGEDGKISVELYTGKHGVSYDYDSTELGYYLSETTSVKVEKNTVSLDLILIDNNPDGSAEKPYSLLADENDITIPANTSYNYIVYRVVNLCATIEGNGVRVTYNGTEYTPENGVISFDLVGEDTNAVANLVIENTTSQEATYKVTVASVPGSYGNPFVVEQLGENVTAEGVTSDYYVYYVYVAAQDGVLTLTMTSEGTAISMTNNANSQNVNTGSDNLDASITLNVSEGDEILICCASSDKNARDAVFTLTLS